ncbi:MAG: tetratricopeptide repeat protein [Planctomycetes bacterium]|nr:tetratricopeptide repeat protein [Planctomycetota bacterium]
MPQPETVTFAVTDIQGSTELWERLGPRFAPILAEHNRIVREALSARGGVEIKTEGDSFTAVFPAASRAVAFALEVQSRLHAHPWPAETGEILVRIGVHAGPALRSIDAATGRTVWTGSAPAVSTAVAAAAHGGQVLLTGPARAAAGDALTDATQADLGEHILPGDARPVRLWQALPLDLAARRFPPPRTPGARATNVPPERNLFVGRDAELRELTALVPSPAGRIVTLTGPGGIGKTRLALHTAALLLPRFPGGAWLVDLSEARTAADVAHATAHVLGSPLTGRDSPEQGVAAVLEFRKPILLVLDGFEGAVAHAAATVGLWARRAREARLLVTSRTLLHIAGEREFPVGPLAAPARAARGGTSRIPAPGDLERIDAVRLFVDRAREAAPSFGLSPANAGPIAEICAGLEGIPLALELAAARLRDLPLDRVVADLDRRLHLLDVPSGSGAERRQTLVGALEWTCGLLAEWERSAFEQASVFHGGFFLDAAEAVIDLSAFPDAPLAMDAVQSLRDKSLLRTADTPFGTRISMFQPVREMGERLLLERADPAALRALRERHARHFVAEAESLRQRIFGPGAREVLERLATEEENLLAVIALGSSPEGDAGLAVRAAIAWAEVPMTRGPAAQFIGPAEAAAARASEHPALLARLSIPLSRALWVTGRTDRSLEVIQRGIEAARACGDPAAPAGPLAWHARLQVYRGELAAAEAEFAEAERIQRAARDPHGLQSVLGIRSALHLTRDDLPRARRDLEEATDIARRLGNRLALARHLANLGIVHHQSDHPDRALACYDEASAIFREFDDENDLAAVIINRGVVVAETGDLKECERLFLEAGELFRNAGNRGQLAVLCGNLGAMAAMNGDYPRALSVLEEAEKLHRELGDVATLASVLGNRAGILLVKGEPARSLEIAREAEEIHRRLGSLPSLPPVLRVLAAALVHLGRPAEAMPLLDEAVGILGAAWKARKETAFGLLATRAEAKETLGRHAEATRDAAEAIAIGRTFTEPELSQVEGFEATVRRLERISGAGDSAGAPPPPGPPSPPR